MNVTRIPRDVAFNPFGATAGGLVCAATITALALLILSYTGTYHPGAHLVVDGWGGLMGMGALIGIPTGLFIGGAIISESGYDYDYLTEDLKQGNFTNVHDYCQYDLVKLAAEGKHLKALIQIAKLHPKAVKANHLAVKLIQKRIDQVDEKLIFCDLFTTNLEYELYLDSLKKKGDIQGLLFALALRTPDDANERVLRIVCNEVQKEQLRPLWMLGEKETIKLFMNQALSMDKKDLALEMIKQKPDLLPHFEVQMIWKGWLPEREAAYQEMPFSLEELLRLNNDLIDKIVTKRPDLLQQDFKAHNFGIYLLNRLKIAWTKERIEKLPKERLVDWLSDLLKYDTTKEHAKKIALFAPHLLQVEVPGQAGVTFELAFMRKGWKPLNETVIKSAPLDYLKQWVKKCRLEDLKALCQMREELYFSDNFPINRLRDNGCITDAAFDAIIARANFHHLLNWFYHAWNHNIQLADFILNKCPKLLDDTTNWGCTVRICFVCLGRLPPSESFKRDIKQLPALSLERGLAVAIHEKSQEAATLITAQYPQMLHWQAVGKKSSFQDEMVKLGWVKPTKKPVARAEKAISNAFKLGIQRKDLPAITLVTGAIIGHVTSSIAGENDVYQLALQQAREMSRNGELVFGHSQMGGFAVLNDFMTQVEEFDISRVYHPKLARERIRFRMPGTSRHYPTAEQFIQMENADQRHFDNYKYTDVLLSVSPDLRDTTTGRSPLAFFNGEGSATHDWDEKVLSLVAKFYDNQFFSGLLAEDLQTLIEDFPNKRMCIIGMSEATAKQITYPAHRTGDRCKRLTKETMIDHIKEVNDFSKPAKVHACCDCRNTQFRILAPEMDNREDVKIYAFDTMEDKKNYQEEIRAIGRWGRCFKRLEQMVLLNSKDAVVDALRRIPLFPKNSKMKQPKRFSDYKAALRLFLQENKKYISHYQSDICKNIEDLPENVVTLLKESAIID